MKKKFSSPIYILGSPSERKKKKNLIMNIEICIELKSYYKFYDEDNLYCLI